jgi:hypothetical protein
MFVVSLRLGAQLAAVMLFPNNHEFSSAAEFSDIYQYILVRKLSVSHVWRAAVRNSRFRLKNCI